MKSKRYAQQSLGYLLNKDAPWWSGQDQLWVSLHSRDPGAAGTQTSSELKYGGYSRIAVKREGWTVNAEGVAANPAPIVFPARQDAGAQIDIRCAVLSLWTAGRFLFCNTTSRKFRQARWNLRKSNHGKKYATRRRDRQCTGRCNGPPARQRLPAHL